METQDNFQQQITDAAEPDISTDPAISTSAAAPADGTNFSIDWSQVLDFTPHQVQIVDQLDPSEQYTSLGDGDENLYIAAWAIDPAQSQLDPVILNNSQGFGEYVFEEYYVNLSELPPEIIAELNGAGYQNTTNANEDTATLTLENEISTENVSNDNIGSNQSTDNHKSISNQLDNSVQESEEKVPVQKQNKPRGRPRKEGSKLRTPTRTRDKNESLGSADNTICPICSKQFSSPHSLRRHEIIHSENPKPFGCDVCSKRFTQLATLKAHKTEIHAESKVYYKCDVCPKQYTRKTDWKNHIKSHTNPADPIRSRRKIPEGQNHECPTCNKTFRFGQDLRRHATIHTGDKKFQCPHCPRTFRLSYNLKEHVESHMNEKKYCSKYCGRSFRQNVYARKHEKVHEEQGICKYQAFRILRCRLCPETFPTRFLYKQHFMQKHHRESALSLKRILVKPLDINSHGTSSTNSDPEWVLCNNCGEGYTKSDYKIHQVLCNLEKNKTLPERRLNRGTSQIEEFNGLNNDNMVLKDVGLEHDLDLNAKNLVECELCYKFLPASKYTQHIHKMHLKEAVVSVNRMLFKPMTTNAYRGLSIVRACDDTFNVPWFLCGKCTRAYPRKFAAKRHKLNCVNKEKYYVARKSDNSRINGNTDPPENTNTNSNNEGNFSPSKYRYVEDDEPFEDSFDNWCDNWAEDIVLEQSQDPRIKITEGSKPQCTICHKYYNSVKIAHNHLTLHEEKKWKCDKCGSSFHFEYNFKSHMRIHTGEKPFACRTCERKFREPVGRYLHEKTHLPSGARTSAAKKSTKKQYSGSASLPDMNTSQD